MSLLVTGVFLFDVYHIQVNQYLHLPLKVAVHPSSGQVSFSLMCTVVTQVILTSTIEGSSAPLLGTGEFLFDVHCGYTGNTHIYY